MGRQGRIEPAARQRARPHEHAEDRSNPLKTLVVVPTYNERENVVPLARDILRQHPSIELLVVDDASPDGTGAAVEGLRREEPRLHCLHRPAKLGIGTAHIAGFRVGLRDGFDAVVTMDADFSHRPEYLPAVIAALENFDLVIGSRYVDGGEIRNWGTGRRLLSKTANFLAKRVLGLPTHDNTGGFRGYRRSVLERVSLDSIRTGGYGFLEEILFLCVREAARVREIPIVFEDRRFGKSKISKAEIARAGLTLFRLRFAQGRATSGRAKSARTGPA
jgi:dolichol-phosphate mannosyltransferase